MGTTVSIGQAVGAGDKHRAAECVGNTVTLFMVLAAALTAVLLVSVRGIVAAVSTPAAAVEGTVKYLTVCFIGIPFITAYNIVSSILRGLGYRRAEYRRGQPPLPCDALPHGARDRGGVSRFCCDLPRGLRGAPPP